MERTIYSKYSNERAECFRIRTDIVVDDVGEKKVYKHALTPKGQAHIEQIHRSYEQLSEAYQTGEITFCPCMQDAGGRKEGYVGFPFLKGESLQEVLKQAVDVGDDVATETILKEYAQRISEDGGEIPFVITKQFEDVFGTLNEEEQMFLAKAGKNAHTSAVVSDIDMILSNFFVEQNVESVEESVWQAIDYEWTFDFPIPKGFLIYRGYYFAYYQVLFDGKWSLEQMLVMAGIDVQEAKVYQKMEEHFQKYLAAGSLPVRNMQRAIGTRIVTLADLLNGCGSVSNTGSVNVPEDEWIHVRKIQYRIDRREYQDGSNICSGWAFARMWDGRCLPVNIKVTDAKGTPIKAEITRRSRKDVADVLKIRRVTNPNWGFDCVWITQPRNEWEIHFSLGQKECVYRSKEC